MRFTCLQTMKIMLLVCFEAVAAMGGYYRTKISLLPVNESMNV